MSERNFDAVMNMHLSGKPNMCTFDRQCGGYLVVEYNGDVYPCDFFVESEWKLGNIREKKLAEFFNHPLMKSFAGTREKTAGECGGCKWLSWCHGGCLKDRLPDRAKGAGRSWFCDSYKALFESSYNDMEQWCGVIKNRAGDGGAGDDRAGDDRAGEGTRAPNAGKVGRNEPCPCGSGKKYKKCCGK